MEILKSAHLMTLKLDVAFSAMLNIGATAQGRRRIVPIAGGTFEGERLRGSVLPGGADWVVNRPDGAMIVDVRIALKTDDNAFIYCTYQGSFIASSEAMARFNRGERLNDAEYRLRTVVRFESGVERYRWLSDTLAIAAGRSTEQGPIYTIFEVL